MPSAAAGGAARGGWLTPGGRSKSPAAGGRISRRRPPRPEDRRSCSRPGYLSAGNVICWPFRPAMNQPRASRAPDKDRGRHGPPPPRWWPGWPSLSHAAPPDLQDAGDHSREPVAHTAREVLARVTGETNRCRERRAGRLAVSGPRLSPLRSPPRPDSLVPAPEYRNPRPGPSAPRRTARAAFGGLEAAP